MNYPNSFFLLRVVTHEIRITNYTDFLDLEDSSLHAVIEVDESGRIVIIFLVISKDASSFSVALLTHEAIKIESFNS